MPLAVQKATAKFLGNCQALVDQIGDEGWQALRQAGHDGRLLGLKSLDYYLELLEQKVTAASGRVHWAAAAVEARQIVLELARQHKAQRVVKAKSMASEEIGLNHALEAAGIPLRETTRFHSVLVKCSDRAY